MGTSTSYSAPPSWSALKNEVTRAARAGSMPADKARQLLQGFIRNNGGSGALAGRGGGGGGAVASGQAARSVAKRLGNFISDVSRIGFENALRKAGWSDLIGRPVSEILNALLDRVGGDASTIEDVDARMALSKLQADYFADAATIEELEQRLINQVDKLDRNVNRKLTICDNPILTTPERCLKFEMTRVNHLIPPFCIPLFSDPLARFYSYRRLSRFAFLWSKSISDLDTP